MRLQNILYPFAALAFSSCNLLNGKCTYEIRSTEAAGQIDQSGIPFATAQVSLSEQRGSLQGSSIYWLVLSDALKGHVLSASFKDSSNPSQVRLDLPLAAADRPEITQGALSSGDGATLGGFRDIIVAGRGVIELQTDQTSQPTVTVLLSPTSAGDWIRPYCS